MFFYIGEFIKIISFYGIIVWTPLFVFMLIKAISLAVKGEKYTKEAVWASVALLLMNPLLLQLLAEIPMPN